VRVLTAVLVSPHVEPAPAPVDPPRGLDVIVCNYRTPDDLNTFLASLAAFPCFWPASLTVANVSPGPADRAVVARWETQLALRHLVFEDNVGYARACNRAATFGRGDVVAMFNADVVLTADALTYCYEALRDNPTWGVLGPRQVDQRNRLVGCGVFGAPSAPRQRAWMEVDVGQCSDIRPDALTVSGSAYFVRREVWDAMTACPIYQEVAPGAEGAFLPTQHYYEETFLSYHVRSHGLAVVFYGPVVMTHLWHRASPHGGPADQQMGIARKQFRDACDAHAIAHE